MTYTLKNTVIEKFFIISFGLVQTLEILKNKNDQIIHVSFFSCGVPF